MTITEAINKVIQIALAEVDYLEKASNKDLYSKTANAGDKNYTKYGYEMHKISPAVMDFPAPWCDAFVDWCFVQAFGIDMAKTLLHSFDDYTVQSAQYFKNNGEWYSKPQRGDQIFFKNSSGICHTGLVYSVDNNYVYTIEGNTSSAPGVEANGGCVRRKAYSLGYNKIAGYGRPNWGLVADLHYGAKYLTKLVTKKHITDRTLWNDYDAPVRKSHALALIDNVTGGMWKSEEQDSSIHWAQPIVISLCGKGVITDKEQWLGIPDENEENTKNTILNEYISKALLMGLIDNATGGIKDKYRGRNADHWGRNCLDSLCDKGIIDTPEAWEDFEGQVSNAQIMALVCKAFNI